MRVALRLGITYLVLAAVLVGLAGCATKYDAQECFGIGDCGEGLICFYGTCQDPGYSIDSVQVELTPPAPYLPQQPEDPLLLGDGFQTLSIAPTAWMTGTVTGGLGGTLVARKQGTLAGHDIVRQAPVDPLLGFELGAVPGTYELTFVPYAASSGSPGRPPVTFGTRPVSDGADVLLAYPDAFVVVSGFVRYRSEYPTLGVADAYVVGTAQDLGGAFLASSSAITDTTGAYTLVFPPGAEFFEVTVRPNGNPDVPDVTVPLERLDPAHFEDVVLGVSPFTLGASVLGDGAPVPRAKVFFEGTNVGPLGGSYLAQVEADDSGNIPSARLLPGDYTITVLPEKTDPYAMSSRQERLESAAQELTLTVGDKAMVTGTLRDHEGRAVSGAQLTWAMRRTPAPREYTLQTDAEGAYAVAVDPGEYEVVIQPPADAGLARGRELVQVTTSTSRSFVLWKPTFVYGRVLDSGGTPLAGVRIAFYSLELSPDGVPVLVGQALTGIGGEFAVPVPTTHAN